MRKKNRHISGFLLVALTIVSLTVMTFVTIKNILNKPVMFGKYCVMQVITGSMEPTLHIGECIIIEEADFSSLKKDDIIAYVSKAQDIAGKIVTHRIFSVESNGTLIMRGDSNSAADPLPVTPEQVVGRYVRKSHFFTWLMSFASIRKNILLIVMICTSIMALYEVRTITRLSRETAEEYRERIVREAVDAEIERLKKENYQPPKEEKKD